MEVDDVELLGAQPHFVQHREMRGDRRFQRRRIEPQRLVPDWHKPSVGLSVGAGEQRHVVAERHQSVDQIGDDALGAAIKLRGHASYSGATWAIFIVGNSVMRVARALVPPRSRIVLLSRAVADELRQLDPQPGGHRVLLSTASRRRVVRFESSSASAAVSRTRNAAISRYFDA